MILYNITTLVAWSIEPEWKAWLMSIHLPQILATGLFTHYQFVKLLEVADEDGPTYALQLYTADLISFSRYRNQHEALLEKNSKQQWGDMACSFSSVMEVIN